MISVVIPIFATAEDDIDLFRETVISVQAQSVKTQLIVVDDGSQREVGTQIEESLEGSDHYLRVPKIGASAARNIGARCSDQPFLFFCDADVRLHDDCLSSLMEALAANPSRSYAYCDFYMVRDQYIRMHSRAFSGPHLRSDNYISTMSLIRREDFPGFDEDLERFQDWALWLKMLNAGKTGVYVGKPLFLAKVGGISSRDGAYWRSVVQERYNT